ncbi:MAG: sce7726 family protein [Syntrophomonadaceae bacterium]|nr:sce7726 family protein [Syntrophomonadaceae bacterium]
MRIYDKDIRKILINKISEQQEFVSDPSTVIVHEMDICIGCARADIAVINGKIHGYEIKSEQDNLERLSSQVEFYNKVFDTVTLVTSEKHSSKAVDIIPDWWGLDCVTTNNKNVYIELKRFPQENKGVEVFYLSQLLWKQELFELLKQNGISRGIKSKTRYELGKIVEDNIKFTDVSAFVRHRLKNRKSWKALQLQQLCDDLYRS